MAANGTGLELKPHEVNRIASPGNETKLTKTGQEWNESLQGELATEAGTVLEEVVLREDGACSRSVKPVQSRVRPVPH